MEFNSEDFKIFFTNKNYKIHNIVMDSLPYWVYPTAIKYNIPGITEYIKIANNHGKIYRRNNLDESEDVIINVSRVKIDEYDIILPDVKGIRLITEHLLKGISDPFTGLQLLYGESSNHFVNKHNDLFVFKMSISYNTSEGEMNDYLFFGIKLINITFNSKDIIIRGTIFLI